MPVVSVTGTSYTAEGLPEVPHRFRVRRPGGDWVGWVEGTPLPAASGALFSGAWDTALATGQPLEDRAAYNGTDDATYGRDNTYYHDRFARQAQYHSASTPIQGGWDIGSNTIIGFGAPVYTIPTADHPRQRVYMHWDGPGGTLDFTGPQAADTDADGLPLKFVEVPVPTGPAGERFETYYGREMWGAGPDQQLIIHDPFTDELWEMWLFRWDNTDLRYKFRWGGYAGSVSTHPATFPFTWGMRATGIPGTAGQIRQQDYADGVIRSVLGVAIPVVQPKAIPPATRFDGGINEDDYANITATDGGPEGRDAVAEGVWMRLPEGYVIDETRFADKPAHNKLWRLFLAAARDYGIVIYDGTGGTTTFAFEGTESAGTPYSPHDPNNLPMPVQSGWGGPLWGPGSVLIDFPWDDLVQIKYGF